MQSINKITKRATEVSLGLGTKFLDLVLPLRCPISHEIVDHKGAISPKIWADLSIIEGAMCSICGQPFSYLNEDDIQGMLCMRCLEHTPSYDKARARLAYNDISRALILKFKHGDQLHLTHTFLPFLELAGKDMITASDIIMPVPLHPLRLLKRKYNQAALLAKALAEKHKRRYTPDLLKRVRHTPQQSGMADKRRKNVAKAFIVDETKVLEVKDKTVLLIDDVYTTGATVNACAKTLKSAGAATVYVLSIARVCKHDH